MYHIFNLGVFMRYQNEKYLTHEFHEIDDVREQWGWFLALGIAFIVLGMAVMGASYYTTIFSMILLGAFLVGGGILQIVHGSLARKWSGFFLSLLLGILYLAAGAICIFQPAAAAITITLWIAVFCFIVGLFRMIASLVIRFRDWGWVFFNGLITFILGGMIYSSWPISGLWVIGLFIGIDMILAGWTWVVLALSARRFVR